MYFVGQPDTLHFAYDGVKEWKPPTLSISPDGCRSEVQFTCQFINNRNLNVANEVDLCSMVYTRGSYSSTSSFNAQDGTFTISTLDQTSFPAGNYDFRITAFIGSKTATTTFTMIMTNPCSTATITATNPFEDKYVYELRKSSLMIPFELNNMVSSTTQADCGKADIVFMTDKGSTNIDSIIRVDRTYNRLVVGSSFDTNKAGEYKLKFKVFYTNAETNSATIETTFSIWVVDTCNPPEWFHTQPTLTPLSLDPQEYTISDTKKTYVIPVWKTTPDYCKDRIEYSIVSNPVSNVASLTGRTMTFENTQAIDLAGKETSGTKYTLTVQGVLGPEKKTSTMDLFIKNPCLNASKLSIVGNAAVPDITYSLGTVTDNTWQHNDFVIYATPQVRALCGALKYSVNVGVLEPYVSYQNRVFEIYTDSLALVSEDAYEYTVTAELADYPGKVKSAP